MLAWSRGRSTGLTVIWLSLLQLICIFNSLSVSVYDSTRLRCRRGSSCAGAIQPTPGYRCHLAPSIAFVSRLTDLRSVNLVSSCKEYERVPYRTIHQWPLHVHGYAVGGNHGYAARPTYGKYRPFNKERQSAYGGYTDSAYAGNEFNRYMGTFHNTSYSGQAYTPASAVPYRSLTYSTVPYSNYHAGHSMPGYVNTFGTTVNEWQPDVAAPRSPHTVHDWFTAAPPPHHVTYSGPPPAWKSRTPMNRAFDPYAKPNARGGLYGSERLQKSKNWWNTSSPHERMSSKEFFSSFRTHQDIQWLNDHTPDDEWPGTAKLKHGETYDGIIRHWLTPVHAVFLTVDKMTECCLDAEGMPEEFMKPNPRTNFRVDHVIKAKLKWPQEFDEKGRPKVVLSLDRQNSPFAYVEGDLAWGTPLLVKENIAIIRLERGEHVAVMYLAEIGAALVDIKKYSLSQFVGKGERIQVQIIRQPSFPRNASYLIRIPWDSPKRSEWAEKFPDIKEALNPYKYGNMFPSGITPLNYYQQMEYDYENPQEDERFETEPYNFAAKDLYMLLPTEAEPQTISGFTKKIGGKLKDILRFLFLQTQTPIDADANLTVNLAKAIYNFVVGRTEFNDIDAYMMESELELLKEKSIVKSLERPPIVVLMGHINHGKTSLFDMLTDTKNIDDEPGNITQSVRTHMLTNDFPMTLIDTPGHEVFDAMRRCGASIADIALIVVDTMEGLKKQTTESIKLCKSLGIPFIIAATKCDLPNAQQRAEDLALQLSEEGVIIEGLGGDTQFLQVSAKEDVNNSKNIILNAVLLQSAVTDDRVVTEAPGTVGHGFVLESGKGTRSAPYCLAILKQGTMSKGNYFLSGKTSIKIKSLKTPSGKRITTAKPSQAVLIDGFEDEYIPTPGESFTVYKEETYAECIAEQNIQADLENVMASELQREIYKGIEALEDRQTVDPTLKRIQVILKAATQGSVDALKHAISTVVVHGMKCTGVFNIVDASPGPIIKSDIISANDANAIILGLGSSMRSDAKAEAKKHDVTVIVSDVIYDLLDKSKGALTERLGDRLLTELYGSARVLKIFNAVKNAKAAGCVVTKGRIPKDSSVRVLRQGKPIYVGTLESLRHTTDSVDQAVESQSCGMIFKGWNDVQVDDIVEAYAP